MSMRGTKRAIGVRGDEAGASKRRKAEQDDALWQLRPVSDLKMSSIYNRSTSEAPAELFRKDLISAMKLPDSEPLTTNEYWVIIDTWKQEWERGVQVPVNPDSLPAPAVQEINKARPRNFQEYKLPKTKYVHLNRDAFYQHDIHQLSTAASKSESACKYDLDATDSTWLKIFNGERSRAGNVKITEDQLEKVIQELELRCWDKIQTIMKSEEGLGIEYDENVICDVCRSPDSEEGNEMVFCDACNICVHQACYGITTIPSGQWLCRPCRICTTSTRPTCVLCPNLGGAMKCTPSGHKWAHVSCVLWIPEVSIGCAEKMEPITKISAIPPSRWSLLCVLCRERKGACIQCSVKTCKTAYHVTCAFKHGLEMRAIIEDENADDGVKLRSYCQKHSVNSKKEKNAGSGSEEDEVKRKRRKDMTSEEKSQARAQRLHEIESEFDKHVSIKDISSNIIDIDQDAIGYIYSYWKLKRRAGHNRPLLPPKADDSDLLSHRQEQADLDKMKMFVQLRQDLERVRNLCYMVSRREKLSRSFFRMREQTFHKQVAVLSDQKDLNATVVSAVIEANHGPSIYDRLYSHPDASDNANDFEAMVACIAGEDTDDDKKKDINGLTKTAKTTTNPYKKVYVNGSTRRSSSVFSGMSSEESAPEINRGNKYRNQAIGSSSEDNIKSPAITKKKVSPGVKKAQAKTERKKRVPTSRAMVESSTEEDVKPVIKKTAGRSRTLKVLEREMSARQSATESDDLMPIKGSRNMKFNMDIYSDTSDGSGPAKVNDFNEGKSPNATNDSQQQLPRTKAAMKQFIPMQKTEGEKVTNKRGRKPSSSKEKPADSDEDTKKGNLKFTKTKDYPSDLIVPQRQAAKKASENMRSTTKGKEAETAVDSKPTTTVVEETKLKPKLKLKAKDKELPSVKDKDQNRKKNLSSDSMDIDKDDKDNQDMIAYVPQRQAAKKAAAHIKSGLGSKPTNTDTTEENKKKESDIGKHSPQKDDDKQSKSSSRSSSCSSSNSSSSSCSSSSSSEDEDDKSASSKSVDVKPPQIRERSLFSPVAPKPSVDLLFLDKVSRPLSSSSPSSDSDAPKEWERTGTPGRPLKRGRPQKSESSNISDEISHKAPDKKLKTSERRSECGIPSPPAQGEERDRAGDARPAPCTGTRSTASSGNLFDKRDSRQRKSIADDTSHSHEEIKPPKKADKPDEPPPTKWKEDEALNLKTGDHCVDTPKEGPIENDEALPYLKTNDNKEGEVSKRKLLKSQKTPETPIRRASVTLRRTSTVVPSSPTKDTFDQKDTKTKQQDYSHGHLSASPAMDASPKKIKSQKFGISSPVIENSSHLKEPKTWDPIKKSTSPARQLPPIEKYGDTEKYMTEDKTMEMNDINERSSLKIIAKIHANINENTMIKSPRTPMDATSGIMDTFDMDMYPEHKLKRSTAIDLQKKLQIGGARILETSHHMAEPQKKIPIPGSNYPNRSIFSPQPTMKDNACSDLFEFGNDILAVDDSVSEGFGNAEIMKPFSFNSEFLFKEDSKEDKGVQETLNLVEKLRMTLSSKKPAIDNNEQEMPKAQLDEKDRLDRQEDNDKMNEDKHIKDQPSPDDSIQDADKSQPSNFSLAPSNDSTQDIPQDHLTVNDTCTTIPETVATENIPEKWHHIPLTTPDPHTHIEERHRKYKEKYDTQQYEEKVYEKEQYNDKYGEKEYEEKQYEEKEYEEKQYEDKLFEEKQYEDKQYEEKQYEEKQYEEKQYEEKQYEEKQYEEKQYEEKQYEEKQYEEKQYEDKQYEEKQYEEKQYEEKQYGEKQYEDKQYGEKQYVDHEYNKHYSNKNYDNKQYDEKMYDDKYDEHAQYSRHMERHNLEKHSVGLSHDMQRSVDQENFRDNISKQSDDSRSINDQSMNSNDQDTIMQESVRSQSYENNNSLPQSDCATISSPRSESKWGESKITQRRSSASSTNSEGSVCSQKLQIKPHLPHGVHPDGMMQEMEYASVPQFPCPPMEVIPYSAFSSEASPFVTHGSVSLFQSGPPAQLPLQSPGAGLYPPNLGMPYNSTSMITNLSKPFTTMCAAFATSSQNLVLTTPMIAPPTPKRSIDESPPDDMDLSTEKSYSAQASPTPSADSFNDTSSGRGGISKLSNESNDTICTQSTLESRSSSKQIKTSARFMSSSLKSPGKSPGISPKTADTIKSSTKRPTSSKNNRGRGRGRSKSRGGQPHYFLGNVDFHGNSIHSKLIGTVYELDFDEDTANDGVDLKAMRERRRSVDVHDRKSDSSCKDSSQSPRVPSPSQLAVKKPPAPAEPKEAKPSLAASEGPKKEASPRARAPNDPQFPAIVQPVLPGPVDMRRYQPLETPAPARESFHGHLLGTFEPVPHQPLVEIDEDIEKELHTALMATTNPEASPTKSPMPEIIEPPIPYTPETPMPKVSLADSRNQLKVKIKGPFRDANYCASVQPAAPPPQPAYEPPQGVFGTPSAVASVTSAMLTGTSNLRRMRKKELLRQYWTQDMNMDDPAGNPPLGNIPLPIQQSPLSRTIITIPKAVASMTTIPTREDYKAVVDANMEKKKRKSTGERELRHLQVTMNDDIDVDDNLLPNFSGIISQPVSRKGRGRLASAKPNKVIPPAPVTPKLKIKIADIVPPVPPEDPTSGFQFRPPKKRLAAKEPEPSKHKSWKESRRESMKFRKWIEATFEDGKKEKKHKLRGEKTEKKKKKKGKKAEKMQELQKKSYLPKLIIKLNKKEASASSGSSGSRTQPVPDRPTVPVDPFEYDPAAPDPLAIDPPSYESCGLRKVRTSKVTPIRLKLARSSEGTGYVMKNVSESSSVDAASAEDTIPVSKHSQAR